MKNNLVNENLANSKLGSAPKPTTPYPKVAIVTDWMYGGGSEKVVEQLHLLYPEAPIYTSYCSDDWRQKLDNKVVTGYLQKTPFRQLRKYLPLLRQWWFAHLNLADFDLVISVTGNGEAKFILSKMSKWQIKNGKSNTKRPLHISYCNTPVHFYWKHYEEYLRNPGFKPAWLARLGLRLMVNPLKKRDYKAAQRVDVLIANSSQIAKDIKKYYNRDSVAIFPPVNTSHFAKATSTAKGRKGFVTMGRQVPMKKNDLIIQACNELAVPLTVIGRGPDHEHLAKLAGPTVSLRTDITDDQMPKMLASAEAFLFASFEDFGIAPVEAQAAGTPVIAYKAGGALDYVVPGKTGEFFADQTVESLKSAIKSFDSRRYDHNKIKKHADKFSAEQFRRNIKKLIKDTTEQL